MTAATVEQSVLKSLRVKFVAVTMSLVALVLIFSFAGICWFNYVRSVDNVYSELAAVLEKPGPFHNEDPFGTAPDGVAGQPFIGRYDANQASFPVAIYQVTAGSDTAWLSSASTATIEDDVAIQAITAAAAADGDRGKLDDLGLFYVKKVMWEGSLIIAFADESNATWKDLAGILALAMLGILAVLLLITLALSRWALLPVQEAWQKQQRFIADASHELKTPLTVILADASIALDHPESTVAQQSQWIEGIQTEAAAMQELVVDMLALAEPSEGAAVVDGAVPVDLSEVAEGTALQFEAVAFEHDIEVLTDVEPGVTVQGNRAKLARMVATLTDNACKYAGPQSAIRIGLTTEKGRAVLTVHNDGEPIDPEDLPHVFDRFYRSDKARTRTDGEAQRSFGLGLAIARKTAEEHGGTLTVASSAEEGTTFTFAMEAVQK